MKPIIVQMSDRGWTLEAMHLASALARSIDGQIVLLRFVLAHNPGLLGWNITPPDPEEKRLLAEYAGIAEDYGVVCYIQPMQYISLVDALAQATELLHADALFAHITPGAVPLWRRWRMWNLKRQLHGCQLYTLDEEPPRSREEPVPATALWDHQ